MQRPTFLDEPNAEKEQFLALARNRRRTNQKRRLLLEAEEGGGGDPNAQTLYMDPATKHSAAVVLSNENKTCTTIDNGNTYLWAPVHTDFEREASAGGKYMFEIACDSRTVSSFWIAGLMKSGAETANPGEVSGTTILSSPTIARIYRTTAVGYDTMTNDDAHKATTGSVITIGIDFDGGEAHYYKDGTLIHTATVSYSQIVPSVPLMKHNNVGSGESIGTFTDSIEYPIDGYTVWG